ncbi:hypothetical protein FEDK69T_04180 [Flavobacterium enshiense DK69]|uniref:DUF434 domain-containing protein n=1 Tax=Flavobacterium enshiense DK69 TaxID=1107311 RepID=V6SKE0_9FLAO|nr:DUF434 domain-containing protein [Flavobacterium enshiense]ESU24865.1 hypothetical protein FEDK69T_04180 [Flavobacterium enshiense DK69]KGO96688.1 hypothetical protein Q767_02980 [Flavobacterium enshiense DK69]
MGKQSNRGKEAKDDVLFGSQARLIFKEALWDLHYLLSRNYSEKNALQTVGTRYKLTQRQIRAIQSMAASEEQLTVVKSKAVSIENLKGKDLVLDGFNVLILLESLFSNAYLFKGLDGCYRDLSSVHGTYKKVSQTSQALDCVAGFYKKHEIGNIIWIFDKPVSNSGRIKKMIEELAVKENLNWCVILENNADQSIIDLQKITVSSDAFIIRNCSQWFNFIGHLIEDEKIPATVFEVDF